MMTTGCRRSLWEAEASQTVEGVASQADPLAVELFQEVAPEEAGDS